MRSGMMLFWTESVQIHHWANVRVGQRSGELQARKFCLHICLCEMEWNFFNYTCNSDRETEIVRSREPVLRYIDGGVVVVVVVFWRKNKGRAVGSSWNSTSSKKRKRV